MRVLGNAAMTLDGRLALPGGARARLSGPEDKARVHRLRNDHEAILVGVGTVLADDPELLVDPALAGVERPRHPLRVVLDSSLRTPAGARVLRGPAPTLLVAARGHARQVAGAEVAEAPPAPDGRGVDPRAALSLLEARGVGSVLVEGGARVHAAFLAGALYDRLTVYVAPIVLGSGAPSLVEGLAWKSVAEAPRLRLAGVERLGEGALLAYERAGAGPP